MDKYDIIYILANASKWQNNEIRYSLRSVERNLKGLAGKVFIVGYLPKFIETKEVGHVDTQDWYTNKLRNAARKVKAACNDPRISEKFILMNDDFFITKKIDEIKYWTKGRLETSMKRHSTKKGYYYTAIKLTKELLESLGIENPIDFEIHAPIIIDKKEFIKIDKQLDLETRGILFRSVYGNLAGEKGYPISDIKIWGKNPFNGERYKNHKIISTDNKVVLDKGFQKWIAGKFKKVSKYEKGKVGFYFAKTNFTYNHKIYNPGEIIQVGELPAEIIKKYNLKLVKKYY